MAVGGRWAAGAAASLLTLVALGACGDVNEGTAFADEFGAFLDTQYGVVDHDSGGVNPLPYVGEVETEVTLDPDLDPAEVVAVATAIVSHRMKTDISSHDLTILFSADSADPAGPVISFYVDATVPLPDNDRTGARLTRLVEEARTWVPADAGITKVTVEADLVTVETGSEPLRVTPALADVLATGQWDVPTLEVMSPTGDRVTVDREGDVAWLAGVEPFVQLARATSPSVTYSATVTCPVIRDGGVTGRPGDPPRVVLRMPEGTAEETLVALEALPPPVGVDVNVFSPQRGRTATPSWASAAVVGADS